MICISIYQESRRFALVDMLNAARQCDLLEVRLDRFGKSPEIGELLQAKPKPIIFSCRRPRDGGGWDGSEDERLALLRQCIISKADYVEIEEDVADQIRPFPGCKRVISYTNLEATPADIGEIYGRMQTKKPDIIKLVVKAGTPEEVWPLVQILNKPPVPTVVVGLGKAGIMLTILARRMGSPWTYAALERGMEAYAEQPSVAMLKDVYRYQDIGNTTRFTGVTGFGDREYLLTALLNESFARFKMPNRVLPLEVGNVRIFQKVIEAVKMTTVVVDREHRVSLVPIAAQLQGSAERLQLVDVLAQQNDAWHGFYLSDRALVGALESTLRTKHGTPANESPLKGRSVMLVGVDETTRAVGQRLAKSGAVLIIASRNRDAAHRLAQELQCRFIMFEGIYSTLHDVLVMCSEEPFATRGTKDGDLNLRYLKSGMTVMDLTAGMRRTPLLKEAELRNCGVVSAKTVVLELALQYAKLFSGKDPDRKPLQTLLDGLVQDDD
jgi:3-dehydroquinate dehydratase/shikimate dehydrogenase